MSKEPGIFLCPVRYRSFKPGVIPRTSDTEHATHGFDAELVLVCFDELVSLSHLAQRLASDHGITLAEMDRC
jgi:hypothetical protein